MEIRKKEIDEGNILMYSLNKVEVVSNFLPVMSVSAYSLKIITMNCVWRFMRKLWMKMSYDPAVPLVDMYPKDSTSCYRDSCASVLLLLCTQQAGKGKQPRCSSKYERIIIQKWYMNTVEFYSMKWNVKLTNCRKLGWTGNNRSHDVTQT